MCLSCMLIPVFYLFKLYIEETEAKLSHKEEKHEKFHLVYYKLYNTASLFKNKVAKKRNISFTWWINITQAPEIIKKKKKSEVFHAPCGLLFYSISEHRWSFPVILFLKIQAPIFPSTKLYLLPLQTPESFILCRKDKWNPLTWIKIKYWST